MFMNLYNFEVIDEDAFMQWKEELNDVHPGKGQALFQVSYLIFILYIFYFYSLFFAYFFGHFPSPPG